MKKKERAFQAGERMSKGTEVEKSMVLQLGKTREALDKEEAKEPG